MNEAQVQSMIEKAIEEFKKSLKLYVYVNECGGHQLEVDVRLFSDDECIASDDDEVYLEIK